MDDNTAVTAARGLAFARFASGELTAVDLQLRLTELKLRELELSRS